MEKKVPVTSSWGAHSPVSVSFRTENLQLCSSIPSLSPYIYTQHLLCFEHQGLFPVLRELIVEGRKET